MNAITWIWIHPFYRNRGVLKGLWTDIIKNYGPFILIESPVSRNMHGFLKNTARSVVKTTDGIDVTIYGDFS